MKWTALILATLVSFSAAPRVSADEGLGLKLKVRAREHFEWSRIRFTEDDSVHHLTGFSNTINVWFEKPMHYSFGFGLGPILASYRPVGDEEIDGIGEKVRLWNLGFESKVFPFPDVFGWFGRVGIYGQILDTNGSLGTKSGFGYLLSTGWEFLTGQIGIAPEVGFRHVFLQGGGVINQLSFALGFHFYSI